jgi:hypothetical protein
MHFPQPESAILSAEMRRGENSPFKTATLTVRPPRSITDTLPKCPGRTWLATRGSGATRKLRTELVAPLTHRLVAHRHAMFEQQLLDVAQAQIEAAQVSELYYSSA